MKTIESSDNRIFKSIQSLTVKKYRDRTGCYLVEGENLVGEAVREGLARQVVLREDYKGPVPKGDAEFLFMKGKLFEKLALTKTSQGILAVVEKPKRDAEGFFKAVGDGNILVMEALQDPGNIGTMLRTAAAAGYKGAMPIKGTGDVYSPKTVRAAGGATFRLPILEAESVDEAVRLLKAAGKTIVGTGPRESVSYTEADLKKNIALVIGNEGNGMSEEFLAATDFNVVIPMKTGMESLNAAVAAGILMYEAIER